MMDAGLNWRELRKKYPVFYYERFRLEYLQSSVKLTFDFKSASDIEFHPEIVIEASNSQPRKLPPTVINNLAFHLGLIESISYWKATCSPTISVRPGHMDASQISWWKDLIFHGMGEFFCVNQIDFRDPDFIRFDVDSGSRFEILQEPLSKKSLLPIGGGRDSAVAGMVFSKSGLEIGSLLLNPTPAAQMVAQQIRPAETITVRRIIDSQLFRLNEFGFLNGHTPFSAYLAFLSALCAVLFDYSDIVLANEHSSNEGNTEYLGQIINHQYSKSLRFEERFDSYLRQYLATTAKYYSFVRPLSELQIGSAFARFPELFGVIKSCNRNPASKDWCGSCPKCLSVFVTTYPFVSHSDMLKIFGKDFFENPEAIRMLRQLAGRDGHKPFECVGTYDEIIAALQLCVDKCRMAGRVLPDTLARAELEILNSRVIPPQATASMLNTEATHHIPKEIHSLLAGLH
jgi:hypothetical protein